MYRFIVLTICVTGSLIFMSAGSALSQSAAPPAPAPVPADFPSYIVTPSEDLNPYNLSTMQKSSETDYRDGAGTLGTSVDRQSNLEVNEALQQKKQERIKAAAEAKAKQAKEEAESQAEGAPPRDVSPADIPELGDSSADLETPGVRGGLFTWTDDQGVLHATNDIGQVPIKYQVEAIENSSENIDLNKGTPDKKRP